MPPRWTLLLLCSVAAVWGKYSVTTYYSDNSCHTPGEIIAFTDSQCTPFSCTAYGGGATGSVQANCSDSAPTAPRSWLEYDTYETAGCRGSPDTVLQMPQGCVNLGLAGSQNVLCGAGSVTYSACSDNNCSTCTSVKLPLGCQSNGDVSVQWKGCSHAAPVPPPQIFCVQLWTNTSQCKGQPHSQVTGYHGKAFELPLNGKYVVHGSDVANGEILLDCVNPPNENTKTRLPMPTSCHYFPASSLPCQEKSITITVSTGACSQHSALPDQSLIPINQ